MDAGLGLSEASARALLDGMFRDAGLRILNDQVYRAADIEVTLDGYDPERGIGYEYISRAEIDTEIGDVELEVLHWEKTIFIAEQIDEDYLRERAARFLSALATSPKAD